MNPVQFTRPLRARSWTYSGLPTVVVAACIIWFIHQRSGFTTLDGLAYDHCFRLRSRLSHVPPQVILIYVDGRELSKNDNLLLALVEKLDGLGASRVAIAFQPETMTAELSARLVQDGRTFVAREAVRNPSDLRLTMLPPTAAARAAAAQGLVSLPPVSGGIYRGQSRSFTTVEGRVESFEALVARSLGVGDSSGSDDNYRISFAGGPGSLPHAKADEVLADRLIAELVRGRVALVGLAPSPRDPLVCTPTTNPRNKMSELEFHGHALNTLLNGQAIHRPGAVWELMLLVTMAVATMLICQPFRLVTALHLTIPLFAVETALAIFLLWSQCIWLPLVPIMSVQIVCLGSVYERRSAFLCLGIQQLQRDMGLRMKRHGHQDFQAADKPWPEIAMFLQQSLSVNRMLIFETANMSCRVQLVESCNCHPGDIRQQHNDYRRAPYSWAIDARSPVNLTARGMSFLKDTNTPEEQFLVPLLFGPQLLGFLVLTIEQRNLQRIDDFADLLLEYSEQVVESLHRRQHIDRLPRNENSWYRLLSYVPEKKDFSDLVQTTRILERRLARLEDLFEKSNTAMAIYDIFGRLVMANARMSSIVQAEGRSVSELTTTDLISLFTQRNVDETQTLVRGVILDKRPASSPIELSREAGSFQLNLRPLTVEPGQGINALQGPSAFQVHGILCELIDQTPLMKVYRRKDELAENLGSSLRNHLAAVEFAAALLATEDQQLKREGYQTMIHQKVTQAAASLAETQLLAKEATGTAEDCKPIEPHYALVAAVKALEPQAEAQGITIAVHRSDLPSHVYADFDRLQSVFESLLLLLLSDARENTRIDVHCEERVEEAFFTLKNSGYGIPTEQLRAYLTPESVIEGDSESDRDSDIGGDIGNRDDCPLHEAVQWVQSSGGHLTATSEIGTGTTVHFGLQRFC